MSKIIQFFVPGHPEAQPRSRARVIRTKAGVTHAGVYNPQGPSHVWKIYLREAAKKAGCSIHEGPVVVSESFFFSRPQRLMKKTSPEGKIPHTSKPDRDNLDKAVLDALTGIAWLDDCQVFSGRISKWYCTKTDPRPGALIMIEYLEEEK